jgi:hypothetical protein
VTSDRWSAYNHLPVRRRQVCWAHLRRDFAAHAEGLAAEQAFGEAGLRICSELFWAWEIYQHTGERREWQRRVRLLHRELKPILRQYSANAPHYKHTRGIARNLLKVWQMGPTPKRPRRSSMKRLTSDGLGRAPWRKHGMNWRAVVDLAVPDAPLRDRTDFPLVVGRAT